MIARPVIAGHYIPTLQTLWPDLHTQPCSTVATPEALERMVADVAVSTQRMIMVKRFPMTACSMAISRHKVNVGVVARQIVLPMKGDLKIGCMQLSLGS